MVRLVHMSDLHFGRDRPELHQELLDVVNQLAPDLVVISGDLTQRALRPQFRAAQAFIRGLTPPVLSVPGNHDVPLYNVAARFIRPFANYRRMIARDLEPVFEAPGVIVAGMNSVDPFSWQRGLAREGSVARTCALFRAAPPDTLRVLVAHHPFEQAEEATKTPMQGAETALKALAECGLDMVLTGHLHQWAVTPFTMLHEKDGALQVQAGTGLSDRLRGEENDFNLITRDERGISITRYVAGTGGFAALPVLRMAQRGGGWAPAP